ncbi:MAG TPA: cell division protein SepF [Methanothermococcus okinawensis]|nr:cell division protein SepF [Methanothermococcus okinawensis]
MVFKSLLKLLKGEEKNIEFGKKSNSDILPVEMYEELHLDIDEEEDNIIRIKVLDLENQKDANEILVWIENGCIVIANTVDLEKSLDEKYLNVIKYLRDETVKMGGKIVRVCNNRILVLPKNVIIEKAVREREGKNLLNIKKEE